MWTYTLNATVVSMLISLVIPILTGLLTKVTLPGWLKGVITLGFNAVLALVVASTQLDGTAVITKVAAINALIGFVISVAAYAGIYRPANVTSSTPTGALAPNAGVGPPADGVVARGDHGYGLVTVIVGVIIAVVILIVLIHLFNGNGDVDTLRALGNQWG